jgi:DegV family protein with EDD domain
MVRIISDSTCDLSGELLKRYGISIIPLHIILGEDEYEDGVDITPEVIYKWSDETKQGPKTSAPSIESAADVMRPLLEQGDELVCFSISSDMSSSANVMRLAASELDAADKVHVVDSMNLSTGIGLLAIEAAVMAQEGRTADEIVKQVEALRPKVRSSFVVDTLTYLYRGGRCRGLAAIFGSTLKMHPVIGVSGGQMAAVKKYRGSLDRVMMNYVRDLEPELRKARKDRVFVTHSGCEASVVVGVKEYLEGLGIFTEILETRAGGVVSSHCGPGTLGVLFIEE